MSETVHNPGGPPIESSAPPYLRCIQWVPRRYAGGVSPVTIVDLVFEQRVFGQVAEHVAAMPSSSVFGALIGHLFEDPTTERRWARVERIVRSPSTIPESADASRLGQTLRATEMDWVPEEGEVLLGWYRTHHEGGLYLSPEEARFHEGSFPEPWSVALVMTGSGERRAGGVFQRTDPEGLSRSVYTPFYELVHPSSEFNGNTHRTFVGWANYQTEARVIRAGRGSVSAGLPERTPGPRAETKPTASGTGASRTAEAPASGTVGTPSTETRHAGTGAVRPAKVPTDRSDAARPAEAPAGGGRAPRPAGTPADRTRTTTRSPGASASAGPTPDPVGPITPPGTRPRPKTRGPAPAGHARTPARDRTSARPPVNSEAEWDKRQIQRSLMAVGRSIGPAELGSLGAPAEPAVTERRSEGGDDSERREGSTESGATTAAPAAGSGQRPDSGNRPGQVADPGPTVIPIHRDGVQPAGLVGRSRRRRRLPVGKILAAAAGLTLVAAAGLVGKRTMLGDGAAAEGPVAAEDGSSMAGLSLSPDALRSGESDPGRRDEAVVSFTTPDADRDEPIPTDPEARLGPERGESANAADESIVRPPSLEELRVEDPVVAGFENALSIFHQEAERYERVRRAFDEGSETCNPLNLSYRGILDAFGRLERRLGEAGERLPAAALRAFDSAERQFAMDRTHYMLTDCPVPVGG